MIFWNFVQDFWSVGPFGHRWQPVRYMHAGGGCRTLRVIAKLSGVKCVEEIFHWRNKPNLPSHTWHPHIRCIIGRHAYMPNQAPDPPRCRILMPMYSLTPPCYDNNPECMHARVSCPSWGAVQQLVVTYHPMIPPVWKVKGTKTLPGKTATGLGCSIAIVV